MLVAAGRGERARTGSASEPKQFLPLGGRAVAAHSLDLLRAAGCNPVIAVVPPDARARARTALGDDVLYADGGDTRRASVAAGLALVTADRVVIHDAARPLATPDLVGAVLAALDEVDGAICAVPVEETLKRTDGDRVVETVARASLYRAQTPQAFRTPVLVAAHDRAARDGFEPTDDAQLLERYGGTVAIVPGSGTNLKLTYPEDFALAEAVLAGRGNEGGPDA